jgi:hypothetical protein
VPAYHRGGRDLHRFTVTATVATTILALKLSKKPLVVAALNPFGPRQEGQVHGNGPDGVGVGFGSRGGGDGGSDDGGDGGDGVDGSGIVDNHPRV